ncbi:MAG: glycosyltransferase family 4 protein [Vicinamibacterales bacterium]
MTSFRPGGTEYQMTELVRRLPPDRWRVHVACFHRDGAWLSRLDGHTASIVEFGLRSFKRGRTLTEMRRFARWCRAERIDVVHASDLYANVFALPAAAAARVPLRIGSRRELNPDKTPGLLALQRIAYGCAHRVLANSEAAAARLRAERVPDRRIVVVPNGLDLTRFTGVASSDAATLVTVANLRPEKGHGVLLRALAAILSHAPEVRLRLVGDGPERERLTALARALGVSHAVEFLGHREDVPSLLASSGIAVVPSLSEAFPNAALEAMAAGLPVVASATGGLTEIVSDGRAGLLVPPDDVAALAAALDRLLHDPALRRRMGTAGRASVEAHYSFERMIASVEALYASGLPADGPAGAPVRVAVS